MKDKLMAALGGFGVGLFYIVMLIFCWAPLLLVLDLPLWADLILIFIICTSRAFGGILCLGLYVWATVVALRHPLNIFSIIYLVLAVLYFLLFVVPSTIQAFGRKNDDDIL